MITIKKAKKRDVGELSRLLSLLFEQEEEFEPNLRSQKRALKKIIDSAKTGRIFVVKDDKKVVAMVNLLFTFSTALNAKTAILEDMIVDPSYRSRGIGVKLISHLLDFCKKREIKRVTLLTDCDNYAAHKFYEKLHFKKSNMIIFRKTV